MLKNLVLANRFYDSVFLMQIASKVEQLCQVDRISVLMGTEGNKGVMKETGLLGKEGEGAGPNDLVIAARAAKEEVIVQAFEKVKELLEAREVKKSDSKELAPRSIAGALESVPQANIAFISLPGPYVHYEARKALEQGLSVMIFSDNVPIEQEIELKTRAGELGLLVMGPDCGTALIKGKALGFANVVKSGPIGIVGASGTGIQEVTVLLANQDIGISHAIGTGSNDLSKDVQGMTMLSGMSILEKDKNTEIILLISKPPDKKVARKIVMAAKKIKKPVVINFLSPDPELIKEKGIECASTLEEAVYKVVSLVRNKPYAPCLFDEEISSVVKKARKAWKNLRESQVYIRGLYSGGTLCEEALIILNNLLGDVFSNTKAYPHLKLKDSRVSREHCLVDMGDDEFTRGTPHPMIDYTKRKERILEEANDGQVAVILFDVVLGFGSHYDPAAELLPVISKIRKRKKGKAMVFIATIIGTEKDPQGCSRQQKALEELGVIVFSSNAQAARFAALVVSRGEVAEKLQKQVCKV